MTIERIFELVIKATGVDGDRVKGKSRLRKYVRPRQIFCWLAVKYTRVTLSEVSRFLGDRHHTSIMYHVNEINDKISIYDDEVLHLLDIVTELIKKDSRNTFMIEIVLPEDVSIMEVEKFLISKNIINKII